MGAEQAVWQERGSCMDAKRGFVPEDERNFQEEALRVMRRASRHIRYLMEEGYDLKMASVFVGNHFLLSERQRLAIVRSAATGQQLEGRRAREVFLGELSGREVWVDGFNQVITLEVLLCDSLLFEGMDGAIRDLASLRGTYRILPQTREAVRLLLGTLKRAGAGRTVVLLDQPVSNSGRLAALIREVGEEEELQVETMVLPEVDRVLYEKDLVASSDSVILDRCAGWVNLAGNILRERGGKALRVWEEESAGSSASQEKRASYEDEECCAQKYSAVRERRASKMKRQQ